MKQLNISVRKADNAPVHATDTVLACELTNLYLAHRQHRESEIAGHDDLWKGAVRADGH
jgi:hypothetical protein